jgi:hypothetical protein
MALINCKECNEQISNQAKSCPKCGAKTPKKTSWFTWTIIIFIILIIYFSTNTSTNTSPQTKGETATQTPEKAVIKPTWETSTSKDEMTGEMSAYMHSPEASSSKDMDFPYSDTKAWIGVGCNKKSEWAYVGFSNTPNLANTENEDGYHVINTRIKWDSKIEKVALTQNWGADFLHFPDDSSTIKKLEASKTVLLELQWHGQQPTYFEISLEGTAKALSEIRAKCKE